MKVRVKQKAGQCQHSIAEASFPSGTRFQQFPTKKAPTGTFKVYKKKEEEEQQQQQRHSDRKNLQKEAKTKTMPLGQQKSTNRQKNNNNNATWPAKVYRQTEKQQ